MGEPLDTLFKAKLSSKGQVVIPKPLRESLRFRTGDELVMMATKEGVLVRSSGPDAPGLRGLLRGLDVDVTEAEAILGEARRTLLKRRPRALSSTRSP